MRNTKSLRGHRLLNRKGSNMGLSEVREDFREVRGTLKTIGQTSSEYFQLKIFKRVMCGLVFMIQAMVLGALAFLFLLLASISAALAIGASMGSPSLGFLAVGLAYLLVFTIAFFGRHRLEGPLLKRFSAFYFDEL